MPGFAIQHGGEAQQVSVNWDAVTDAHEYIVEYRLCSAEPCGGTFTVRTLSDCNHELLDYGPECWYPVSGAGDRTETRPEWFWHSRLRWLPRRVTC